MSHPSTFTTPGVRQFAEEIDAERQRQLAKFGDQHHPDGTGNKSQQEYADHKRRWCEAAFGSGYGTWADILAEEVAEVEAERDPAKLRAELLQVAAVCAAWVADIDSRTTADHVCNSIMARGEMDEPLGYLICGMCGKRKSEAQR
ncbi:hypothetical protein [Streptomyces bauhiniae]|uniref:hypothetical protein n=1 Tax=Streptomyces bauhiniae TaxID=2340725 RepID=UPI0035DD7E18